MKNYLRRGIVCLLMLALVIGLMACGGNSGQTDSSEAQTSESTSPASEASVPDSSKEETSESSEETTTPTVEPGTLPLVPEGEEVTITIGVMQNANTEDYETNDYTKWIEEQTGVNLDFVYFSSDKTEAAQQLSLMIAGGDKEKLPDIIYRNNGLTQTQINEYGEDGYLVDLKPYFDAGLAYYYQESADLLAQYNAALPDTIMAVGTDPTNGALYGWPYAEQSRGMDNCASAVWVNAKWLEAVESEKPTTVEELYESLVKFRDNDPNGNGQKDEIPLITFVNGYRGNMLQWIINAFVYCNDSYFFNATDGEIWQPYTTEEYRQALIYMNKLYDEGLIAPVSFTMAENGELTPIFTPSDGTAIAGYVGGHPTLSTETDNWVLFEYEALTPLADATGSGRGGYRTMMAPNLGFTTAITTDCENPELAFRLLDFMSSAESMLRSRYGERGRDWDWAEEGKFNVFGVEARVNVIDSSVYANQNNACWHFVSAGIMNYWYYASVFDDNGSFTSERAKLAASLVTAYETVPAPDEVVYFLAYNAEEQAVVDEYKDTLLDYIKTARAQFISGVLDPNNDAAWQEYVAACEAQGINEYTAATQSCYTRMNNG